MKAIKFKTNLKCNGCISAVTPALNNIEGLAKWDVDLTTPDRVLNVEADSDTVADNIIKVLENAGYEAVVL